MLNLIAKPFGMLLMFLYELVQNYGVAVILFAIAVKLILLPFQMKSKRGTMRTTRLQPKMQELQKKHGANQQKYNEELQKLYKEEGASPMSGCLWGLLPFPIMIALYQAIRFPLTIMMGLGADLVAEGGAIFTKLTELGYVRPDAVTVAYEQIAQSQFIAGHFADFAGISEKLRHIDYSFIGIDLGAVPNWKFFQFDFSDPAIWVPQVLLFIVPVVSGVLSLVQVLISTKLQPPPPPQADGQAAAAGSMKAMMYVTPVMSLYFAFIMPAALGVYWTAGTILQIIQEVVLTKHYTKILDAEDEVKNRARVEREAELERRRAETERLKAENKTKVNPATSKKKQELAERKEREQKAVEWAKRNVPEEETEKEQDPARVGNRKYARGRAYDPERFPVTEYNGGAATPEDSELPELAEDAELIEDAAEGYELMDDVTEEMADEISDSDDDREDEQ